MCTKITKNRKYIKEIESKKKIFFLINHEYVY